MVSIDDKLFSLFNISMPVNITQNQLDTWVSEAEQGYDLEALKSADADAPVVEPVSYTHLTLPTM